MSNFLHLIGLIGLFVIASITISFLFYFIKGIFSKRRITISNEILINRNRMEVFEFVRFLFNQRFYIFSAMVDPDIEREISGIDGYPGAKLKWNSSLIGKGYQEIVELCEGSKIIIHSKAKRESHIISFEISTTEENVTQIIKTIIIKPDFPFPVSKKSLNRFNSIQRSNLLNLKNYLEKK